MGFRLQMSRQKSETSMKSRMSRDGSISHLNGCKRQKDRDLRDNITEKNRLVLYNIRASRQKVVCWLYIIFWRFLMSQVVTLLWIWKLSWNWAYHGVNVSPWGSTVCIWILQCDADLYSAWVWTMLLFKPRSWCVYCPMGTMTQLICKGKMRIEK